MLKIQPHTKNRIQQTLNLTGRVEVHNKVKNARKFNRTIPSTHKRRIKNPTQLKVMILTYNIKYRQDEYR